MKISNLFQKLLNLFSSPSKAKSSQRSMQQPTPGIKIHAKEGIKPVISTKKAGFATKKPVAKKKVVVRPRTSK